MRPFLTARWVDLLLVTWKVPDALLLPHLPRGIELDRLEGSALVSLVAFDFRDTRVFGLPWPGFVNFPELNLRFYVRNVRDGGKRGVVFLREYVPSVVVAQLANLLYNEPYRSAGYSKDGDAHVLVAEGRAHRIAWKKDGALFTPPPDSVAHFLKEHDQGFGTKRDGTTLAYRVEHPVWRVWPEVTPQLDVDTGALYGSEWAFLRDTAPFSVVAAEGSEVAVFPAEVVKNAAA